MEGAAEGAGDEVREDVDEAWKDVDDAWGKLVVCLLRRFAMAISAFPFYGQRDPLVDGNEAK